jgi:uncharacterized membrane protein (UPF0127 family)
MKRPHFLAAAAGASEAFGLRIVRSGEWLATHAQLAGSSSSRRRGLLGATGLPPGHALVIAPTQGVHTFGMRFAIDVVGVNRDGEVVSLRPKVPRRRLVFSWRAFAIVEAEAGRAEALGLRVGDQLDVIPFPRS